MIVLSNDARASIVTMRVIPSGGMLKESEPKRQHAILRGSMSAAKSYDEIIDFIAAGTTPQSVLAFRPSKMV